ncbi:MAG: ComF family protein [Paracoccaceae bacterium]
MSLQAAIHFLYPPQCLVCGEETSADFALCGSCWRDAPFINGLVCDACGVPLPGEAVGNDNDVVHCDACLLAPRTWSRGRAAFSYEGTARRLVLGLKHGDRQEFVRPMATWMAQSGRLICGFDTLVVPVPLHARRLFSRRFNQSALLAKQCAARLGLDYLPDLLTRTRATMMQEGMTLKERYENQKSAFQISKKRREILGSRSVLLVDDVLTSGATLSGCAEVCLAAGARHVNVLVLARVARGT